MDGRHILREADIMADNQGKEVYFLLNIDGSLPFPGTYSWKDRVVIKTITFHFLNESQFFSIMVYGLLNE